MHILYIDYIFVLRIVHTLYNKYTQKMIIANKILKIWSPIIEDIGYYAFAKGAGVNYRTVKKAIDTGKCKDWVFEAIQKFVSERKQAVKKMIEQDQD